MTTSEGDWKTCVAQSFEQRSLSFGIASSEQQYSDEYGATFWDGSNQVNVAWNAMAAWGGGESVFRGSLFRAGYEVFYTPIPTGEKRAAKSLIDVGFDRLGDALGGGAIPLFLMVAPQHSQAAIMTADRKLSARLS